MGGHGGPFRHEPKDFIFNFCARFAPLRLCGNCFFSVDSACPRVPSSGAASMCYCNPMSAPRTMGPQRSSPESHVRFPFFALSAVRIPYYWLCSSPVHPVITNPG